MTPLDTARPPVVTTHNRMWGSLDSAPKPSGNIPRWYCIHCRCVRDGFLAETSLAADGWRVFHPLHFDHWRRRIEPLFPAYLFVRYADNDEWPRILRTRGVGWLLGEYGRPTPLPLGSVEDLMARTSDRRIVDDPLCQPLPAPGATVRVVHGPLAGWAGIVQLSRRDRLRVLLELFGSAVTVELNPGMIVA